MIQVSISSTIYLAFFIKKVLAKPLAIAPLMKNKFLKLMKLITGVQRSSEVDINAEAQRRLEIFLRENQVTNQSNTSEPIPGTSRSMSQKAQQIPETRSSRSFRSGACSLNNDDLMTDDLSIVNDDDTKEVYIKKIECTLNQNPLDQVEDNQRNSSIFQVKLQNYKKLLIRSLVYSN